MTTKILVVYYSYEGSTRLISENIAQEISADILECKPIKDLSSKGFSKYFWGGRQVIFKKKPELEPYEKNPNDYDLIIIGTPVWAFNYSPAIRSFLSQTKLSDKKIALFCCHEGGIGKTLENLKKDLLNNTVVDETDFLNVFDNKEKSISKAINWAKNLKEKI
jgi:flavodoxin